MMKKFIVLCYLVFCCVSLMAQENTFKSANKRYSDGDYEAALKKYQSILKGEKTSANLYFNLANTHYKLNDVPESVFYYEKALQLNPTDQDIKNNLKFANKRTIDAIEVKEKTGASKIINNLIASYDVKTWAWISIGFAFIMGIFFLVYRFTPRQALQRLFFSLMVICFLLSTISVYFAFQQNGIQQSKRYGIVFKKQIDVRAEPNPGADLSFELHEGTKVQVLENFNGYFKIELADGQIGWLKTSSIKTLDRSKL